MERLAPIKERMAARAAAGLAVAYLAVLTAETLIVASNGEAWPFELSVGVAVGILAFVRRRHPTGTAVLGLALCAAAGLAADLAHLPSQPGFAATLALVALGASCMRSARALPAAGVALAGIPVMVVGRFAARPDGWPLVFIGLLCWLGAVGLGLWLRSLDARRREAVAAAQREERLQLARELHDVVAHHVTGIVLQAQAAQLVAGKHPEAVPEALAAIETAGADALKAMRHTIGLLRGDDASGRGVRPERLDELVSRFAGQHPTADVSLSTGSDEDTWSPATAATVQGIVQEALTNVARHAAGARTVQIEVAEEGETVTISITDDAPAAPATGSPGGYGLLGMRERVTALGGRLDAGPRPGGGWRVSASLPLATGSAA